MARIIEFNEEEMDWLDNGNGFCALMDLAKEGYDEISYKIMLKIRNAYNKAELIDERKYSLALTHNS